MTPEVSSVIQVCRKSEMLSEVLLVTEIQTKER